MESGFAMFDTAIGRCGIAWTGDLIRGLQLPEPNDGAAIARLERRFSDLRPADPLPPVRAAIEAVTAFLSGATGTDLGAIALDLDSVAAWDRQVYREARDIPVGRTVTYGSLAQRLGDSGMARAVGQALGRNPWPIVIPCHRILAAGGGKGGFSAPGGTATKLKLLEIEGALTPETLPLFAASPD